MVKESLPQAPLGKLCKASVPPAPPVPRDGGSTAPLTVKLRPRLRPLTRKDIPVIVKAVMDAMPGAVTHQPLDDVDTVERPGELDNLCCKIVSCIPFCVHAQVRG